MFRYRTQKGSARVCCRSARPTTKALHRPALLGTVRRRCALAQPSRVIVAGLPHGKNQPWLLPLWAFRSHPASGKLARMRKPLAKHNVAMAVQPGAPIFELSVPCEVFGVDRPAIHDPWYEFWVCPTEPATEVASGFVANRSGTMADLAKADTVIVLGCENIHVEPPTTSWPDGWSSHPIATAARPSTSAGPFPRTPTEPWLTPSGGPKPTSIATSRSRT